MLENRAFATPKIPPIRRIQRFITKPISQHHYQDIANLYQAVRISPQNITDKINISHNQCFSKTGGIFNARDSVEIQHFMNSPDHLGYCSISDLGELAGFAFFDLKGKENINKYNIDFSKGDLTEEEKQSLTVSLNENRVSFTDDIVVSPLTRGKKVFDSLIKRVALDLLEKGYNYNIFESRSLLLHDHEFTNPSYKLTQRGYNAKHIYHSDFYQNFDGFEVLIRSNFLLIDLRTIL